LFYYIQEISFKQLKQHDIRPEYGNIIYVFDINQETIDERLELDVSIHDMSISRDGFEIFGLTEKRLYDLNIRKISLGKQFKKEVVGRGPVVKTKMDLF